MTFIYREVDGDVLEHKHNPTGKLIIPHCVNTLGMMGAGIAAGIAKKWPFVENQYRDWYTSNGYYNSVVQPQLDDMWIYHIFELGECQFVEVEPDIYVCNMIGQKNIGPNEFDMAPIRMDSLRECIFRLRKFVVENDIKSVASPKFGSLRAGGAWSDIEVMIREIFRDVSITWITYNYVEPTFGRKQERK